jgi:hypothetical protein
LNSIYKNLLFDSISSFIKNVTFQQYFNQTQTNLHAFKGIFFVNLLSTKYKFYHSVQYNRRFLNTFLNAVGDKHYIIFFFLWKKTIDTTIKIFIHSLTLNRSESNKWEIDLTIEKILKKRKEIESFLEIFDSLPRQLEIISKF